MARLQTMVQLTDDLIELLDAEAGRRGISRSALIRTAVEAYLSDSRQRLITNQLVEGYTAIPQGARDEWGDIIHAGREASRRTLRRLDREEEAAGQSW